MSNETNKYPEHEKQRLVLEKAEVIGKFIEHIRRQGYEIMKEEYDEVYKQWFSYKKPGSIQDYLAEFFGIDMQKINQEKMDMLNEIRGLATVKQ